MTARPFTSVLVANRGEIAVRILRTVQALGMEGMVVYHAADAGSPAVRMADRAIEIDGPTPVAAYLDAAQIVAKASAAGAEAIHPGYGFLSENADFARAVAAAGIVFVGPTPEAIELMGDKVRARNFVEARGFPVAPSAIEDDDPVIFLEPKRLYNGPFDGRHDQAVKSWAGHPAAEVPEGHYTVPLGKAAVVRPGEAVTVLAYGTMVHVALAGIDDSGVDAELIDLRSIVPLDIETIVASVKKTGRCVIVHEASRYGGFGGELSALVQERCFYELEAPIGRVAGYDTPYPHAFEWDYFPGPGRVAAALRQVTDGR